MAERIPESELDAIAEASRLAHNGPWDARLVFGDGRAGGGVMAGLEGPYAIAGLDWRNPHDVSFVCGSRAWVPRLVEALRDAYAEIERLAVGYVVATNPGIDEAAVRSSRARP